MSVLQPPACAEWLPTAPVNSVGATLEIRDIDKGAEQHFPFMGTQRPGHVDESECMNLKSGPINENKR